MQGQQNSLCLCYGWRTTIPLCLVFPSICSQKKSTSQLYPAEMDPSHAAAKRIELYSGSEARNFGLMPHFTSEQRQQFVFVTVRCAQLGSGSVGRCKTQRMDLRPALSFFEGILQISTIITSWQTFTLIMRVFFFGTGNDLVFLCGLGLCLQRYFIIFWFKHTGHQN